MRGRKPLIPDSDSSDSDSSDSSDSDSEETLSEAGSIPDSEKSSYGSGSDPMNGKKPKSSPFDKLQDMSEAIGTRCDLLLLCPARVPASCLRSKEWGWILIDRLEPIQWNPQAFEMLQMESRKKSLIRSLVKGHQLGRLRFDDIMKGKGRGLVFLLERWVHLRSKPPEHLLIIN